MPTSARLPISHARLHEVETEIFWRRFAPDCMTHECRRRDLGRVRLDACCQYGADVTLPERDAILARASDIAPVLRPELRDPARWFDTSEPEEDPEAGTLVRTGLAEPREDGGCVFLEHDLRGCALHRAALEHGFDPASIKPAVCRLYPLAYGEGLLGLSDDFSDYSCGDHEGPTVYRLMRETIGRLFGLDAVRLLDAAERQVLRRRLPVAARTSL